MFILVLPCEIAANSLVECYIESLKEYLRAPHELSSPVLLKDDHGLWIYIQAYVVQRLGLLTAAGIK